MISEAPIGTGPPDADQTKSQFLTSSNHRWGVAMMVKPCQRLGAGLAAMPCKMNPGRPLSGGRHGSRSFIRNPSRRRAPRAFICLLALTTNDKLVSTVGERRGGKISAQLREDHHLCDRLIRRFYCQLEQAPVFSVITDHLISLHCHTVPRNGSYDGSIALYDITLREMGQTTTSGLLHGSQGVGSAGG
jgi:hypothetical protein